MLCMGLTVCHSTSILQPNNIQNGSTCARRTSRGTWSLLPVFGVIMTETISSKLSSPDLPSAASVVCDPKFFSTGERTLLGLRATVDGKDLISITMLKMLTFICGRSSNVGVLFKPFSNLLTYYACFNCRNYNIHFSPEGLLPPKKTLTYCFPRTGNFKNGACSAEELWFVKCSQRFSYPAIC